MNGSDQSLPLYLKRHEERRLLEGHAWIYSNEVDTARSPLTGFAPGAAVDIISHTGRWLGSGYVNPKSLICARVVSRDRDHPLDRSLLVHRLNVALGLRERLYPDPYYRLVYGESDGLPGLVIDRYGDVCVVQITTAGMDSRRADILDALDKVVRPRGVVLRCDHELREIEGLELFVDSTGDVPAAVDVPENKATFSVPLAEGQKTGWFYDHRDNRTRLLTLVRDRTVLDAYSYLGAWGIETAVAGATRVVCVESAHAAATLLEQNITRNEVGDRVQASHADTLATLKALRAEREHFDVVVLDPPAFAKRKKDIKAARQAYRKLNEAALQVLSRDGLLVTCSCSYHLSRDDFLATLREAARHIDRGLQILYEGGQSMDHPVHPAMPETRYLKCFFLRVLPRN